MKKETLQEKLLERFKDAQTMIEKIDIVDAIAVDIINTDPAFISVEREHFRNQYKIKLWMNEYHFGKELSEYLMRRAYILTLDDETKWTLEDLREHIEDFTYEFAYNYEEEEEEEEE